MSPCACATSAAFSARISACASTSAAATRRTMASRSDEGSAWSLREATRALRVACCAVRCLCMRADGACNCAPLRCASKRVRGRECTLHANKHPALSFESVSGCRARASAHALAHIAVRACACACMRVHLQQQHQYCTTRGVWRACFHGGHLPHRHLPATNSAHRGLVWAGCLGQLKA